MTNIEAATGLVKKLRLDLDRLDYEDITFEEYKLEEAYLISEFLQAVAVMLGNGKPIVRCREIEEVREYDYADISRMLRKAADEFEQAIAATLDKPKRIYILRGTDPGVMPSCGGETNELLGVFATREAAEEAISANGRMYCDLNVTEWEVDE